ncbi:MAG: PEP-CTERM sorting domain-containing protein [Planctomycetes bacterium]|nr:PEP-CTERM sorting domain-containing protein [Planctomycetota bacterium]
MFSRISMLGGVACSALLLCLLCPCGGARGQTTATWTGAAGNGSYNDAGNWDIGVVPINTAGEDYIVVIGGGVAVQYDVPDGLEGYNAVTQLSLAAGSTISLQGRNLVIRDSAGIAGKVVATSGSLTAAHPSSTLSGSRAVLDVHTSANPADAARIALNASGTWLATDASLNNASILSVHGPGAAIELPYLTAVSSYADHWGTHTRTISATGGGVIDLSGVTLLRGGSGTSGGLDRLRVIAQTGGTVNLSALQQIDGYVTFTTDAATFSLPSLMHAGSVNYELPDNSALSLPELISQNGGGFAVTAGTTVAVPKLEKLNNAYVSFTGAGAFNAPALTDFAGSVLTLADPAHAVATGGLGQADNARFILSGGTTFDQITDSSYVLTAEAVANITVMQAAEAGTVLDAGSLATIDSYADHWGTNTRTIMATGGGVIDLSGVTLLRGGSGTSGGLDRLRVIAQTGGTVNLSALQQIDGYVTFTTDAATFELPSLTHAGLVDYELPNSALLSLPELISQNGGGFAVTAGTTVAAPKLEKLNNAYVSFAGAGAVDAPLLTDFAGSVLTLADPAHAVATGGLGQADNARFILSGGTTFDQITDSSYMLTGSSAANTTVMSAAGAGTVLDAGSLAAIDSYADHWGTNTRTISASGGGLIDLSGVLTVRGGSGTSGGLDKLRVVAQTGGVVDLGSLAAVDGYASFEAMAGGTLRLGDLAMTAGMDISADGLGSTLAVRSLMLDAPASVTVTDGAEIALAGSLQNDMTDPVAFNMDTGLLRVGGAASAWLEVAGQDLGGSVAAGNFGIMQLVAGAPDESVTVFLTDLYDNDGLGQDRREALYLFGSGGLDGLALYGQSELVIGDVPVYAWIDGAMVELHSLFGPGDTIVPFTTSGSDGLLVIPEPATLSLLALGALVAIRRRRRP